MTIGLQMNIRKRKRKAKGIINRVHQIILDAVKAEMPDFGDESVDDFWIKRVSAKRRGR